MKTLFFSLSLLGILVMESNAQNPTALDIMKKNTELLKSNDEQAELIMTLVNEAGKERIRKVQQYIKRDKSDNRSSLIKFLSPADVKGTGFLSIENGNRDDDQWLYLPALQKVRRISASNETDNFIGSDFTFEDLQEEEIDQYDYKLIGAKDIDGLPCYHIQAVPGNDKKRKESGYSKRDIFINKENLMILQTNFYNKQGEVSKVYKAASIKQIGNTGKWRAYRMVVENLKTHNKTILQFQNYVINKGIDNEYFSQRYLEKDAN